MVTTQPLGYNYDTGKYVIREFDDKKDTLRFNYEANHCQKPKTDCFEKSKTATKEILDDEKPKKKERHLFKALVSAFITGGGQMLDGRFGDGIKQGLSGAIIAIGGYAGSVLLSAKGKLPLAMIVSTGSTVAYFINKLHSVADAYCGGD